MTLFLLLQDDLPVILEVNSVPALGPGSLIERQATFENLLASICLVYCTVQK